MMEGIEVLATGTMGIGSTANWGLIIVVGLFIGGMVGIIVGFCDYSVLSGLGIGLLVFLLVGSIIAIITEGPAYTVPTYKVIIEDTVSMNDFSERYEIINQEGKIFTIRERMDETNNHQAAQ